MHLPLTSNRRSADGTALLCTPQPCRLASGAVSRSAASPFRLDLLLPPAAPAGRGLRAHIAAERRIDDPGVVTDVLQHEGRCPYPRGYAGRAVLYTGQRIGTLAFSYYTGTEEGAGG